MSDAPNADERVLSTLNIDGTRRWLKPRLSLGRFFRWRRLVAYFLILFFAAAPYVKVGGQPLILLDIIRREFTFFGKTFLPTDTVLLALLMASFFLSIFFVTALFGRVWCGWICPQTVYMEWLYRPIERFFEGSPGRKAKPWQKSGALKPAKYFVFLLVSMFIAHTFLAYFVGIDQLFEWVRGSPLEHPTAFIVMAVVTGLMMFDFCFFREQVCIVACPYGRFQSVTLDRHSLIVTYDAKRGEPRGKKVRKKKGDVPLDVVQQEGEVGDCVDCNMCVETCPTGIDIRDGLQLECVGCAQCVDACNTVMAKLKRPLGLVRYSSQALMEGTTERFLRPRTVLYPLIILVLFSLFTVLLVTKSPADVMVLRGGGLPFMMLDDGTVANQLNVKIVNRTHKSSSYNVSASGHESVRLEGLDGPVILEAGESATVPVQVELSPAAFSNGPFFVTMTVDDGNGFSKDVRYRLHGPRRPLAPSVSGDGGGGKGTSDG